MPTTDKPDTDRTDPSKERGPEFYDARMDRVMLPLETSPWKKVYETTADFLDDADRDKLLVDVACGTGRFAKLIAQRGFTNYWGFDFSPNRIEEAKRYNPTLEFSVADVFADETREQMATAGSFVMLEVLEHLVNDVAVLECTPPGSDVVLSVPNFDSKAHVRVFDGMESVHRRYGHLFDPASIRTLEIPKPNRPERSEYVFRGRRRD